MKHEWIKNDYDGNIDIMAAENLPNEYHNGPKSREHSRANYVQNVISNRSRSKRRSMSYYEPDSIWEYISAIIGLVVRRIFN